MRQLKSMLCKAATVAAVGVGMAGCQRVVNVPRGAMLQEPEPTDQAMEIRDWDRSVAYYTNPRFMAWSTRFRYETPYYPFEWWYAATDTLLFLGQIGLMPVNFVRYPPFTPVVYAGETLPPTWHAMPPLPPGAEPDEPLLEAPQEEMPPPEPPEQPAPPPVEAEPIEPAPPEPQTPPQ